MKRRLLFSLSALAGAGLATLVLQTGMLPGAIAASSETYRQLGLFGDVYDRVRTGYVEPPNEAKLIEGAINGMLTSLDPHSSYLSPNEFKEMQTQTRGEFGGLGIEVTLEEGASRSWLRLTRPPPPERAFWPTTSSPRSTASPCRARPSIRPWTRCAAP